jgi:hypothetical protein
MFSITVFLSLSPTKFLFLSVCFLSIFHSLSNILFMMFLLVCLFVSPLCLSRAMPASLSLSLFPPLSSNLTRTNTYISLSLTLSIFNTSLPILSVFISSNIQLSLNSNLKPVSLKSLFYTHFS